VFRLIKREGPVSLRILEHLLISYCKFHKVVIKGRDLLERNELFSNKKRDRDICRRGARLPYRVQVPAEPGETNYEQADSTLSQMATLIEVVSEGILDYAVQHEEEIRRDLEQSKGRRIGKKNSPRSCGTQVQVTRKPIVLAPLPM